MNTFILLSLLTWLYHSTAVPTQDNHAYQNNTLHLSPLNKNNCVPKVSVTRPHELNETKTSNCYTVTTKIQEYATEAVEHHHISIPTNLVTHHPESFPTGHGEHSHGSEPTRSRGDIQSTYTRSIKPKPTGACSNRPGKRWCWGDHNIDTDCKTKWPNTGAVVEV